MNDPGIHAEASVIKKLQYLDTRRKLKWEKIHIIVVRLKKKDGDVSFSMSKPCVMCKNALQKTKINYVSWSNDYGSFDTCRVCELHSDHISRKYRY